MARSGGLDREPSRNGLAAVGRPAEPRMHVLRRRTGGLRAEQQANRAARDHHREQSGDFPGQTPGGSQTPDIRSWLDRG